MNGHDRVTHRYRVAADEAPVALLWLGLLIFALSILNYWVSGREGRAADALHLGVVVMFLGFGWLTSRRTFPPALVPWVTATAALAVVAMLELEVLRDPTPLGLAYVLMAMIAFGPLTLDYVAQGVAGVLMLAGLLPAVAAWDQQELLVWMAAGVAAVGLGAVLLRIRLRGIDALGMATARLQSLAMRDPLTGLVNRHGIEERIGELASVADRHHEPLFMVFIDVDGLKRANDVHGHDFGDGVLVTVANALRTAARTGDLVGRWGGDEFIVVGVGEPPVPADFELRVVKRVVEAGMDPAKWRPCVSAGVATVDPASMECDRLLADADAAMYQRRRARRIGVLEPLGDEDAEPEAEAS
ncbi:MAG: diguanylate cyclase [Actinomycetales bacterium]|nr:diguanylate cyclase [Actinomycetales bacterium]